ncbi:hypothetical protein KKR91_12455 [Arthrobacter jiangjiafuii]|uniref:Uncharacterized protein n=1 Tax=Arthrobacter jiangjiafuii TaxID=2817475 RepID=A0A975M3N8_9MICC|nr:hypothetical protein [Arthrobacter jiangjiafuii]MBP3044603.1 hypothetical protein [Arthrobacter jiangjiafuii]QWC09297.1 hypothetical protein KKR91_12455 [Arthrobacter jiangjiafuii]
MRWDALFADLEAQLAGASLAMQEAEVSERHRTDFAAVELTDRLRSQTGRHLKVQVGLPGVFSGELRHVGSGWVVLEGERQSAVVSLEHAVFIEGMDRFSTVAAPLVRLGLASAVRGLSRDRSPVRVFPACQKPDAAVDGSIDRVGRDFLELSVTPRGEPRRPANVLAVYTVPLHAVAAICLMH